MENLSSKPYNGSKFAESESVALLTKVQNSSLVAIGVFEHADLESAFIASELSRDMIARVNLPLISSKEMSDYDSHLDETDAQFRSIKLIQHIQESVQAGNTFIAALQ